MSPTGDAFLNHDLRLFEGERIAFNGIRVIGVELRKLSPNGTITNDKFCLSRHVRLHLSHWRLARRSQANAVASLLYPCDRDESTLRHRGGSNEATPMDLPPSASGADGSSAPLG